MMRVSDSAAGRWNGWAAGRGAHPDWCAAAWRRCQNGVVASLHRSMIAQAKICRIASGMGYGRGFARHVIEDEVENPYQQR